MFTCRRRSNLHFLFYTFAIIAFLLVPAYAEEAPAVFTYDSASKRDPFVPLIKSDRGARSGTLEDIQSIDEVTLEGIVWDVHGESIAILNGTILKEGQTVGAVNVSRIGQKDITLSINKIEHTLSLIKKGDETGEE